MTGFSAGEIVGARCSGRRRPCRRWLRGGGAPGGPYAPAGGLGSARGGPRRLGHARVAAAAAAAAVLRWQLATAVKKGRGGTREAKERAAELVVHADGHEEARGGGDAAWRARPAGHGRRGRARSAVAAARRRGNGGGRQRLRSWASRGRGAATALAAAATRAWPPGNGGHDAGRERQREGGSE